MVIKELNFDLDYNINNLVYLSLNCMGLNINLIYTCFFNRVNKINIYYEFRSLLEYRNLPFNKYVFIVWYVIGYLPTIYNFGTLFHIGKYYFSLYLGLTLKKLDLFAWLYIFGNLIRPEVGFHGWDYYCVSNDLYVYCIRLKIIEIFGELVFHYGLVNLVSNNLKKKPYLNTCVYFGGLSGNMELLNFLQFFKIPIVVNEKSEDLWLDII